MKKFLSIIILTCILIGGLTGCQSAKKDKELDAKTREKYYLERIDAYRDYYKDYEDKYDIKAGIAIDKEQLPVMWIMIMEDEYETMIKLVTYDNEEEKIVVLGEEWINTFDSNFNIIPNEEYLVLECCNDLIVYDEEKKELYYDEDAGSIYERFGMTEDEFLTDGDAITKFYEYSGVVYKEDKDKETITYIGEVTHNPSGIKLYEMDVLSFKKNGICILSNEYWDDERILEEYKKFVNTSKFTKKAESMLEEYYTAAEKIKDMSVDKIASEYDISKKDAQNKKDEAKFILDNGLGYFSEGVYQINYANGKTKNISYNQISKYNWGFKEHYVWLMKGLGFETLLDKLYRCPAYTVGDLEMTYCAMERGYTIEEFNDDMIPTEINNDDISILIGIRNALERCMFDDELYNATPSENGADVTSGKINVDNLFDDSKVSLNLVNVLKIELGYEECEFKTPILQNECNVRVAKDKGRCVIQVDAKGSKADFYIDIAGFHYGHWTE